MKTSLRHQDHAVARPVQAAFLRGGRLGQWLQAMGPWQIPLAKLECYVVPQSLQSREPAGLLVIFPAYGHDVPKDLQNPCYLLGNKLALPLDAELFPATTAEELDRKLLYPRQFYHPTLGLVGFEPADRLQWGDHLLLSKAVSREWNHAHPGFAPTPPLQHAKVPPANLGDTLKGLGGDIGTEPLQDDSKDPEGQEGDSIFGRFKSGLMKGAYQMTKGIMDQFPEGQGESGAGYNAFAKFASWLGGRMQGSGLEEKRMDALDKLLDLFGKNMDEALRHAIPLDNPFAGRGVGEMGSDLPPRDTQFDWSKLGGATQGATWNVDSTRYQLLREKYKQAANDAVAAGDFAKAAYIYAHLLHDFPAAANVLQQGKLYREAAVIYKEQLKNLPAAAECLEKGGLLLEAIDLYLELRRWEKAGDLYRVLGKEAQAIAQFERCVEAATAATDFVEAGRLLYMKMNRLDRALVAYLMGWHDGKQGELCLRLYLSHVLVPPVDMGHQVSQLFHKHTAYERRHQLLSVLADNLPKFQDAASRKVLVDLAYSHYSELAVGGQPNQLIHLRAFEPDDRLFSIDLSRYTAGPGHRSKVKWEPMRLNRNIRWFAARPLGACNVAIGREGTNLWMARWNLDGKVEYMNWMEPVDEAEQFEFLGHEAIHGELVLLSTAPLSLTGKTWVRNSQFDTQIRIATPMDLPTEPERCGTCMNSNGQLVLLCIDSHGSLRLNTYASTGELQHSVDVRNAEGNMFSVSYSSLHRLFHAIPGGYVVGYEDLLMHVNQEGRASVLILESDVYAMAVARLKAGTLLAFATENGCHVMPATAQAFEDQDTVHFSTRAGAYLLEFVGVDHLVAVWEDRVEAYEYQSGGLQFIGACKLDCKVAAVLPFLSQSFTLLLEDGQMQVYEIENGLEHQGPAGIFLKAE